MTRLLPGASDGKEEVNHSNLMTLKFAQRLFQSLVDGQWLTFPFPFVHHQPHDWK